MAQKIQTTLEVQDKGSKTVQKFAKNVNTSSKSIGSSFGGIGKNIDNTTKSVNTLRSGFVKLSAVVASLAIGKKITDGLRASVKAASRLEEVTNKFNVVFRDQMTIANTAVKELVGSYQLSTRAARQYLASVQDLLKPMGVATEQAAVLSSSIVKLAADLGSFNNMKVDRVIEDINSALVGNFETMKKYGVVLNETVVKNEAYATGLAKVGTQLNAAQKAQAAHSLIMKGSADAIGDIARSSDSYANQIKQAQANAENMAAVFGGPLTDALAEIVKGFNEWYKINQNVIDQKIHEVAERLADALITVSKHLPGIITVMKLLLQLVVAMAAVKLVGWFLGLGAAIASTYTNAKNVQTVFGGVGDILAKQGKTVGNITNKFGALSRTLVVFGKAGLIAGIIIAILALTKKLFELYQASEKMVTGVRTLFFDIGAQFAIVVEKVKIGTDSIKAVWANMIYNLQRGWNAFLSMIGKEPIKLEAPISLKDMDAAGIQRLKDLEKRINEQRAKLLHMTEKEFAIGRAPAAKDAFKKMKSDLGGAGIMAGVFDTAATSGAGTAVDTAALKAQADAVKEMSNEILRIKLDAKSYEMEMLKQWYFEQQELLKGNHNGLLMLEEAYRLKKMEVVGKYATLEQDEHMAALEESLKANKAWAEQAIQMQDEYATMYNDITEKLKLHDMDKYEQAIYLAKKEYEEKLILLKKWLEANAISTEEYVKMSSALYSDLTNQLAKINDEKIQEQSKHWQELGATIKNSIGSALGDVINGTKTWAEAMSQILGNIAEQLWQLATTQITAQISSSGGGGSSSGGWLGDALSIGGSILKGLFFEDGGITPKIPGAADGNVFSGPRSGYPVMMHGNEAVIPLKGGKVPVQLMGDSGGQTNVFHINVTSNNSPQGKDNDENNLALAKEIKRQMKMFVREELIDQRRAGGLFNSPNIRTI